MINFSPEPGFQPNSLAYADKHREQDRQGKLAEYQTTGQWPGMDKRKDSKKLQETKVKPGDQANRVSDNSSGQAWTRGRIARSSRRPR